MIYLLVTLHIQRRRTLEWSQNYEKHVLPILTKHGQKLVGSWKTTIGVYDEVTNLYAFENYGEMERIRKEVAADPDWIEYMKGPGLINHEICKLIEPLSFSPMK